MTTRPQSPSSSPSQRPAKLSRIGLPDKPFTHTNVPETARSVEEHTLSYSPRNFRPTRPAFQQPVPLLTFSYVSTPDTKTPTESSGSQAGAQKDASPVPAPPSTRHSPLQGAEATISRRKRVQHFTNASLRYLSSPPPGADLNYGYDRWLPRAETRTRLDGLLRALLRADIDPDKRAGAVAWRGVMTKCVSQMIWPLNA